MTTRAEITRLLDEVGSGRREALDELLPLVYDELRKIAGQHLRNERDDHTLNATALVHEAYIKLVDQRRVEWQNRAHFYAIASMAMRRILVSYARARGREKRGGGVHPLELDELGAVMSDDRAEEIVDIDQALEELAGINARAARVVECRFFGGLSIEETAAALDIAPMTVKRDWLMAKTWLKREIG